MYTLCVGLNLAQDTYHIIPYHIISCHTSKSTIHHFRSFFFVSEQQSISTAALIHHIMAFAVLRSLEVLFFHALCMYASCKRCTAVLRFVGGFLFNFFFYEQCVSAGTTIR